MPNNADSKTRHAQDREGGISKQLISLTLPLLSLQWALLPIVRSSFERDKDRYIKAIGNFVSLQTHALEMTLDPRGKLRSRFDDGLEDKLQDEIAQMLDLWVARVITLIEIQEVFLPRMIKRLNDIRNTGIAAKEKSNVTDNDEQS